MTRLPLFIERAYAKRTLGLLLQEARERELKADLPEVERCAWTHCSEPLPLNAERYPYCSARCALEAEADSHD